jgi:5-methylcytosine-specific restriction protein A
MAKGRERRPAGRAWEAPAFDADEGGFLVRADDEHVRRERAKAREMRASAWWKRRRSEGVCHYCGRRVGARALTMDHVVPLVRGGRSTKGNVVPACKECNAKKKHRLAFEIE